MRHLPLERGARPTRRAVDRQARAMQEVARITPVVAPLSPARRPRVAPVDRVLRIPRVLPRALRAGARRGLVPHHRRDHEGSGGHHAAPCRYDNHYAS